MEKQQILQENLEGLIKSLSELLRPPPKLTISEWADKYRYISPVCSSEPGKWRTERAPYLKGIMDAISDARIERVVIMKAARMGATECINNAIGYYMQYDPCGILYVQQTLDEGKKYSEAILKHVIEETPVLRDKIATPGSHKAKSRVMYKEFPGGNITITGANSPTGFRMVAKRVVICDDIDGFESNVGGEGDPVELAIRRADTYLNRKIILVSSPTVKGFSRIESAFNESDKRYYYVPCPFCDTYQILSFGGKDYDYGIKWEEGRPETAYYLCEKCHGKIKNYQKTNMLKKGQWIATAPFVRTAGFHINKLYSPWVSWSDIVSDFLASKDIAERLMVFVNTTLGELWEEKAEGIDEDSLMNRRESYGPILPAECGVLTCAVDVQKDRLELEVVAWGKGKESWGIEYKILMGDTLRPEVWNELDQYLKQTWLHPSGQHLHIMATCIDAGYIPDQVYSFVRPRQSRHIIAVKGDHGQLKKIISDRPSKRNKAKVNLYTVGQHAAKEAIYRRLKITIPGPGYMHFPMTYPKDYFEQLTSEKLITVFKDGFPRRIWRKKEGARNEALDIRVYNLAALAYLEQFAVFDLDKRVDELLKLIKDNSNDLKTETKNEKPQQPQQTKLRRTVGGWITRSWSKWTI